jgi:hypothetical protein
MRRPLRTRTEPTVAHMAAHFVLCCRQGHDDLLRKHLKSAGHHQRVVGHHVGQTYLP